MGLQSALNTALTGMNAAETTIDVVGNNVANSQTVGFKESDAVFATQFLQTYSLGSAPSANTGGTNPRQVGLGTQVAQITPNFTQGTIDISANPLDMAIQGDGFFVVQGASDEQFYTRNGQFSTNSDNELVTINGQRVLGFGVDDDFQIQRTGLVPLTIPLDSAAVAEPTQNVFLEGTLIPTSEIGDTPGIIQSAVLSDGSIDPPANLEPGDIQMVNAPDATLMTPSNGGAGNVGNGTYRYRITFVDADGNETSASTELNPITTIGGVDDIDDAIQLNGLPDDPTYDSKRVYRTDASGAGDYHFVTELASGVLNYLDAASDADLLALPDAEILIDQSLDQGNYSYYVTFYDTSSGAESRPTARIVPESVSADNRRIRLENIPTPGGDFDAVRIYRNLSSDSSTFYRVAQLNGGETSFIDGQPDAIIEVPGNEVNLDGPAIKDIHLLTDVMLRDGSTYSRPFEEGTLSFTGRKGGRALGTQELEITSTTTIQDFINFVNESMGIQEFDPDNPIPGTPGGSITDGRIQFISNMGEQNALDIDLSAFELSVGGGPAEPISLPFASSQTANGEGTATDFVVYDSLGIPLSVRITTVLESKSSSGTTYRWFADSPDNDPAAGVGTAVGTGVITFDGEGNMASVSESTISIDRGNIASFHPLVFELDFSQISGLAEETSSLNAVRQDGSGAGTLSNFIITESGSIVGVFSNGVSRDLGQVRLARFANNTGLEQVGENLYATGVNSGLAIEGDPGENGIGTITAGAVELSNTDIGQNLIELILASTQYRGGARVITAVQQLFDELMALRR